MSSEIRIVGRPRGVVAEPPPGNGVLVRFEDLGVPCLPKGLPRPEERTAYAVYLTGKQWGRLRKKLVDEQDAMVIEGLATVHPEFRGITVVPRQISTKKLRLEQVERIREAESSRGLAP